jgi:hypothetical protein
MYGKVQFLFSRISSCAIPDDLHVDNVAIHPLDSIFIIKINYFSPLYIIYPSDKSKTGVFLTKLLHGFDKVCVQILQM